ncbi:rRNA processing/ribosome biogenesis-domain-containing protein [Russula compacta]|nr:rRNA processing/ribosome biogenesis-domain-containing protein [Russula compacta]
MSASDPAHPLKTFLQLQLASDNAAVLNLPYVIQFLSPQHLQPSPHLQKWLTRINSLIHSKDPGARWAGLSIACHTSLLSRELMLEHARGWVSAALHLFSKQEPLPTLKAAIRLLTHIFSVVTDTPEFQRQIASPNVPKFSLALIIVAEGHPSRELKLLAIDALYVLVPLYPTLHKALHGRLSTLCLRQLNCSAGQSTDGSLSQAISRLYSVLAVTGGKVGAAGLWRKSVDEILSIGWASLGSLRTTFPNDANMAPPIQYQPYTEDATVSIPLNVDRLRCAVLVLCDLLTSTTARAIQLPLGALVSFSQALLSCTNDNDKEEKRIETSVRTMEETVVPEICALGSDLLSRLANSAERHLTPHAGRFTSIILFHLELAPPPNRRLVFLQALVSLLTNVHTVHSPPALNRIAKVLLSTLSVLLPTQSDLRGGPVSTTSGKGRKGKKRAYDYEADEIFKITTNVICPTSAYIAMILITLDALPLVLHNPCLPPATYSLVCRVLLGLNVWLPSLNPVRFSGDPSLHAQILRGLQSASMGLGAADTRSAMGRSLGLIIHELLEPMDDPNTPSTSTLRELDRLLHPRVPSLARALPHVEVLSLFRAEESAEEQEIRESLRIGVFSPSNGIESTGCEGQASILAPAPAPQPLPPNPDTLPNVGQPKTPAPIPLKLSTSQPQATTPPGLRPAPTPPYAHHNSLADFPSQDPSDSNDILCPPQEHEVPPSFMSTVVAASEGSRLGTVPGVINAVEEDDDDEEMPSIDMGSDSD